MWLEIKRKNKCGYSAKYFLRWLELYQYLPYETKAIILNVHLRNAYWAHSENVLLSMLSTEDQAIRAKAVEISQEVLQGDRREGVRVLRPPKSINTSAKQLTDWTDYNVPIT